MSFKEEGSVEYIEVDGKKVPVVQCEAEITLKNTKTGKTVRINMINLIRDLEILTGRKYIENE